MSKYKFSQIIDIIVNFIQLPKGQNKLLLLIDGQVKVLFNRYDGFLIKYFPSNNHNFNQWEIYSNQNHNGIHK